MFGEFRDASYAKRYEILLTKMLRERLYDAASLILSPSEAGRNGAYSEPCPELTFANFAESLVARPRLFEDAEVKVRGVGRPTRRWSRPV